MLFIIVDSNSIPSDEHELTTYGDQSSEIFMIVYGEGPDAFCYAKYLISSIRTLAFY